MTQSTYTRHELVHLSIIVKQRDGVTMNKARERVARSLNFSSWHEMRDSAKLGHILSDVSHGELLQRIGGKEQTLEASDKETAS